MLTRAVVLGVGAAMIYFGYLNFLRGFESFRMPSMLPIAYLFAIIPVSGVLVAIFSIEQMWNGWRNGFEGADERPEPEKII
jgi:TRAP-type C4-dicarboxylate transport system permease small subunit